MSLEKKIRCFLSEICIEYGFCLPPRAIEKLASKEQCEVDELVRSVFEEEGLDPDLEIKLFRQVKRRFSDKYGANLTGS